MQEVPPLRSAAEILIAGRSGRRCVVRNASLLVYLAAALLPLGGCGINRGGLGGPPAPDDAAVGGSGGAAQVPDAPATGGAGGTGGSKSTGGTTGRTGGAGGSAGTTSSGGTTSTGGSTSTRSSGGALGTGGVAGSGGVTDGGASGTTSSGGTSGVGGATQSYTVKLTGGATGAGASTISWTGGAAGSGGTSGAGGSVNPGDAGVTGGTGGSGGITGKGGTGGAAGTISSGGKSGTGGASGSGGATICVLGQFQAPELFTGLGLDTMDLWGPSLSADGKTLYFAASTNYTEDDIYVATRPDRGTAFSAATALDSVNTNSADGSPALSYDGLTLYFYSTRPGGNGGRDIWRATRSSLQGNFGSARVLANVNGPDDDNLQWVSQDELTMVFSSTRSGGSDLYVATRAQKSDDFGMPAQLGGVNGMTTREDRAALSNNLLTIYFTSDRAGGQGDKDIWEARRANTQSDFANLTNLQQINGPQRDIDISLSSDETELVFASNRSGRFRLYRSIRVCQ